MDGKCILLCERKAGKAFLEERKTENESFTGKRELKKESNVGNGEKDCKITRKIR